MVFLMQCKFVLFIVTIFIFNNNAFGNELICEDKKNITYFSNMDPNDPNWRHLGPEKYINDSINLLDNFGIITNNFEKDGSFEFIFNKNGKLNALDFNTCEEDILKWEHIALPDKNVFKISAGTNNTSEYLIKFGFTANSYYPYRLAYFQKGIQDCHNEMNPICHKLLTELDIIGYSDLKSHLSYNEQRDIYLENERAEIEAKQLELEKLLAEEKAKEEKLNKERLKREKAEEVRLEKERLEREKAYLEKEKFDRSPYGMLFNAYTSYMMIKDLFIAREDFAVQYITSNRMTEIRDKMKKIENKLISENDIIEKEVWNAASKSYKEEFSSSMDLIKSTGAYDSQIAGMAKLQLYAFDNTYIDIMGSQPIEKDF